MPRTTPTTVIERLPGDWRDNDGRFGDDDAWTLDPSEMYAEIFDDWLETWHPDVTRVGDELIASVDYERDNLYKEFRSECSWDYVCGLMQENDEIEKLCNQAGE